MDGDRRASGHTEGLVSESSLGRPLLCGRKLGLPDRDKRAPPLRSPLRGSSLAADDPPRPSGPGLQGLCSLGLGAQVGREARQQAWGVNHSVLEGGSSGSGNTPWMPPQPGPKAKGTLVLPQGTPRLVAVSAGRALGGVRDAGACVEWAPTSSCHPTAAAPAPGAPCVLCGGGAGAGPGQG